jgi:hypothetical protein
VRSLSPTGRGNPPELVAKRGVKQTKLQSPSYSSVMVLLSMRFLVFASIST